MSFNFEFYCKQSDAAALIHEQIAPEVVKAFLLQGISAFIPGSLIWVRANGHLFDGDYQRSSSDLLVQEVCLRIPIPKGGGL